jgi:hypothetical protein
MNILVYKILKTQMFSITIVNVIINFDLSDWWSVSPSYIFISYQFFRQYFVSEELKNQFISLNIEQSDTLKFVPMFCGTKS